MSRNRSLLYSVFLLGVVLHGCASYKPRPAHESPFLQRAQTQVESNVRVKAAVPDAAETRQIFGVDLYRQGIQPVWIEIENNNDRAVWFLPVSLDPMYFTPLEASFKSHFRFSDTANEQMDRHFFKNGQDVYVQPKDRRAGFVFTNLDEGTKAFVIDLVGDDRQVRSFTFFIPVPGLKLDHRKVNFRGLYRPEEWVNFADEEDLIDYLRRLPCCTANKAGSETGDPLNLVVIGSGDDVYHAFIRAGWDETETITAGSALKTGISYLFGGRYRYSPVSALYVFGRPQDLALQKARTTIHERNHLRLWLAPALFQGQLVWVGQISRDIGVRFTTKTLLTHKIDPDVDETRSYLIQDLLYSQGLGKFAFVQGVGAAPIESPRQNLTGDPYFTDGLRAVLWVSSQPVGFEKVDFIDWELPAQ
ncbi:MAG: hypothetical protein AMJ54_16365 [Deltaproteobacteria bacterium SG8_13]|nr:MAG: hypothetical protein AMJ54_16365 [Deltaproteobacteria bacterium SG8_13]